jgi:hypothetical protein
MTPAIAQQANLSKMIIHPGPAEYLAKIQDQNSRDTEPVTSRLHPDIAVRSSSITLAGERHTNDLPDDLCLSSRNGALLDIHKTGITLGKVYKPKFLQSYQSYEDQIPSESLQNAAFVYDNALAVIAFLAAGEVDRAKSVVDAIVFAQSHDRFFDDGRLRNAYDSVALVHSSVECPLSGQIVRLPSWKDASTSVWFEDSYQVGTATGNMAWAMLALLSYYETSGGDTYLQSAQRLGEWIDVELRDVRGEGGYMGGVSGGDRSFSKWTHKSTEENIDLVAAFERLAFATGEERWNESAKFARNFVLSMWDDKDGKFWVGTSSDGKTVNRTVVALDVQAWAVLSLRLSGDYLRALEYVEHHMKNGRGFAFSNISRGVWLEGTAHMASAYAHIGEERKWRKTIDFLLESLDQISGGLPATKTAHASTGFHFPNGEPWLYHRYLHVGATAWLAIAQHRVSPFAGWAASPPDSANRFAAIQRDR